MWCQIFERSILWEQLFPWSTGCWPSSVRVPHSNRRERAGSRRSDSWDPLGNSCLAWRSPVSSNLPIRWTHSIQTWDEKELVEMRISKLAEVTECNLPLAEWRSRFSWRPVGSSLSTWPSLLARTCTSALWMRSPRRRWQARWKTWKLKTSKTGRKAAFQS